jgi:hypothetical protein
MLVAAVYFATALDASAYIDPGSSSYFFQLLIAGLTAVVFFFSSIKQRVLGFFKKGGPAPEEKSSEAPQKPNAESKDTSAIR